MWYRVDKLLYGHEIGILLAILSSLEVSRRGLHLTMPFSGRCLHKESLNQPEQQHPWSAPAF